ARRQRNIRARVAVQIDDDADEDLMAALLDIPLPPSFLLCNVERPPLFRKFFGAEGSTDGFEQPFWAGQEPLELSSSSSSSYSSSSSEGAESSESTSNSDSDSDDIDAARKHALHDMRPDQIQTLVMVKRNTVDPYSKHPNRQLAELFNGIYLELYTTLTYFSRCAIVGVDYKVQVMDESPHDVQVVLTATVVGEMHNLLPRYLVNTHLATPSNPPNTTTSNAVADEAALRTALQSMGVCSAAQSNNSQHRDASVAEAASLLADLHSEECIDDQNAIELTTLSYLPRRQITAHVGRISLHFVQEVHIDSVSKGPVGMGAFVFSFMAEVQALARAHTAARGGMAMIALSVDQVQILRDDRSQAYATISVSGDVVRYKRVE
ncbi:hypothetical protein GGF37_005716, partial [Kickxella alabastrina]